MATIVKLIDTVGSGSFIKPYGVTSIKVECWGAGGNITRDKDGNLSVNSGGGGGGAYSQNHGYINYPSESIGNYPRESVVIPYYVAPPGGETVWETNQSNYWVNRWNRTLAWGGAPGTPTNFGVGGGAVDGTGSIKFNGGNGSRITITLTFSAGGGGAGSTGNGKGAVNIYGGDSTSEFGGEGADGTRNPGLYGGGAHYTKNGGLGAQGLIRITYEDEIARQPKIVWNGNTINFKYILDNAVSYSVPFQDSQFVQTKSGKEASWIKNTIYVLEADVRWIPTITSTGVTGWDGATGWRAFLEYARKKNSFQFYPDKDETTYIDSFLADPIDGTHTLEFDGSRKVRLIIRNTTNPYTGY